MRQTLLARWEGALLGSMLPKINRRAALETIASWQETQLEGMQALAATGQWHPNLQAKQENASAILIQALPLLLFLSDQPFALEKQLQTISQAAKDSLTMAAMGAYAIAITQATAETLSGKTFFQHLKATLNGKESYKVLETLESSLEKEETLQQIRHKLPATCQDIWLALYCFATTPDDLTLSVRRVGWESNPALLALVGSLSAVHNGVNGIPVSWRCQLQKERTAWKATLKLMWATWSGSYKFAMLDRRLEGSVMTIAPSGVIQPRQQNS